MVWKILGWLLVASCLGNLFGTGNILAALIAAVLAYLCFRKAGGKQTKQAQEVTVPTAQPEPFSPVSGQNTYQNSLSPAGRTTVRQNTQRSQTSVETVKQEAVAVDQKFTEILAECFPEYSVKRNVDFSSLTSEWWVCSCGAENIGSFCAECGMSKPVNTEWTCQCGCRNTSKFCADCGKAKPAPVQYEPIDFLLMRDGMPKLAILLVTRRRWNNKLIRNTIQACEAAGIPWQRYFEEYDNDGSYVTDRIAGDLR